MKIWVDDIREAPDGYVKMKTVWEVIHFLSAVVVWGDEIEEMSLDHDAGDCYKYGGDYIEILKWLEELKITKGVEPCKRFYFHTGNPVGRENMRRIIKHCGWEEVEYAEDFF